MITETEREFILKQHGFSANPKKMGKRRRISLSVTREISLQDLNLDKPWEVSGEQKISHYEEGQPHVKSNLTISTVSLRRKLTEAELQETSSLSNSSESSS